VGAVAGHRGIEATTAAIVALLETASPGSGLPAIRCAAYRASDLTAPMGEGISLYLHHVSLDASRNALLPMHGAKARATVLEMHYLLTAWAPQTARQQRLLGWAVETLLANPILSAQQLNGAEEIFGPEEQVEVVWEPLSIEQLAAIWQVAPMSRQPSGSFVARLPMV
jgi:hypothetical protein